MRQHDYPISRESLNKFSINFSASTGEDMVSSFGDQSLKQNMPVRYNITYERRSFTHAQMVTWQFNKILWCDRADHQKHERELLKSILPESHIPSSSPTRTIGRGMLLTVAMVWSQEEEIAMEQICRQGEQRHKGHKFLEKQGLQKTSHFRLRL